MPGASLRRTWLLVVPLLLCSCDDDFGVSDGAVPDLPAALPDLLSSGEGSSGTGLDFVVQGCPALSAQSCKVVVPASLTFSGLLPEGAASPSWNMGDGSALQTGPIASHTYAEPGAFDVTLVVSTPSGMASERKASFVVAQAVEAGGGCATDTQCVSKQCRCQTGCSLPLVDGLCLETCASSSCTVGRAGVAHVCVDLTLAVMSGPLATRLCLPACSAQVPCTRTGFRCRFAPTGTAFAQSCVPASLGDIADPCRKAGGTVENSQCLGGLCLDMGASGYCSADCSTVTCPEGTRCARLTKSGKSVCLRRCSGTVCTQDPWLACEAPDKTGDGGFEILGSADPVGTRYCAPRRCTASTACGLSGQCIGGFCQG